MNSIHKLPYDWGYVWDTKWFWSQCYTCMDAAFGIWVNTAGISIQIWKVWFNFNPKTK